MDKLDKSTLWFLWCVVVFIYDVYYVIIANTKFFLYKDNSEERERESERGRKYKLIIITNNIHHHYSLI